MGLGRQERHGRQKPSNSSEKTIVFLNDMNLAALSIAVVILMAFVLARPKGLEKQLPNTKIFYLDLKSVKIMGNSSNKIDGFTIDVFAYIDGKIIRPETDHPKVTIRNLSGLIKSGKYFRDTCSNWMVELQGEFNSSDKLIFYLSGFPSSLNQSQNIELATFKIAQLDQDQGKEFQCPRNAYFGSVVAIPQLLKPGQGSTSSHPLTELKIDTPSIKGHTLETIQKSTKITEVGVEGNLARPQNQPTLNLGATFRSIDLKGVTDLPRHDTPTILFNHMKKNNINNTDKKWQARLLLESFQVDDISDYNNYINPFYNSLSTFLTALYPPRTTAGDQQSESHRWHCYRTDNPEGLLMVQSVQSTPLINSKGIWIDPTHVRSVFLSPVIHAELTSNSSDITKSCWDKIKIQLSEVMSTTKPNWVCIAKNKLAYPDNTIPPTTSHHKKIIHKVICVDLSGIPQKVTLELTNLAKFPEFLLGYGPRPHVEQSWLGGKYNGPLVLLEPQTDKILLARITLISLMMDTEFSELDKLGVRQNPGLWSTSN